MKESPCPRYGAGTPCWRNLSVISPVADRVDESGFALFDLLNGAFERGFQVIGVFEWAFGIPAHGAGEAGEIGIGPEKIHADMRAARIGAAGLG